MLEFFLHFVKNLLERKDTYFCCVIFSIFECISLKEDCFFLVKTLFKKKKKKKLIEKFALKDMLQF